MFVSSGALPSIAVRGSRFDAGASVSLGDSIGAAVAVSSGLASELPADASVFAAGSLDSLGAVADVSVGTGVSGAAGSLALLQATATIATIKEITHNANDFRFPNMNDPF